MKDRGYRCPRPPSEVARRPRSPQLLAEVHWPTAEPERRGRGDLVAILAEPGLNDGQFSEPKGLIMLAAIKVHDGDESVGLGCLPMQSCGLEHCGRSRHGGTVVAGHTTGSKKLALVRATLATASMMSFPALEAQPRASSM